MHPSPRRIAAAVVLAWAFVGLVVVPSFAASPLFQAQTDKNHIAQGESLTVFGILKHANPSCDYSVAFSVSGPDGSWSASSSIRTSAQGSGRADVAFPEGFPRADTNAVGAYTVTATFSCGYSIGSATSSFLIG